MQPQHLVLMRHGTERIGIDLQYVREISRMLAPRKLPGLIHGVLGVIDLRGELIPVIDLEARLRAGAEKPGLDHHLVVVSAGVTMALAVSHVEDIEQLSEGGYRTATLELPRGMPILGMARTRYGLVPVLNPVALMDPGEVVELRRAVAALGAEAP